MLNTLRRAPRNSGLSSTRSSRRSAAMTQRSSPCTSCSSADFLAHRVILQAHHRDDAGRPLHVHDKRTRRRQQAGGQRDAHRNSNTRRRCAATSSDVATLPRRAARCPSRSSIVRNCSGWSVTSRARFSITPSASPPRASPAVTRRCARFLRPLHPSLIHLPTPRLLVFSILLRCRRLRCAPPPTHTPRHDPHASHSTTTLPASESISFLSTVIVIAQ